MPFIVSLSLPRMIRPFDANLLIEFVADDLMNSRRWMMVMIEKIRLWARARRWVFVEQSSSRTMRASVYNAIARRMLDNLVEILSPVV